MPVTIWSDAKRTAICTTPKVACTEIIEYMLWSEVGPPLACPFVNHSVVHGGVHNWESYIKGAEPACASLKVARNSAPYGPFTFTPVGTVRFSFSLATPSKGWRVVVPVRDPWKRLISGFGDKFGEESRSDETLFAHKWMQQADGCSEANAHARPELCQYFNHAWLRGKPNGSIERASPLNNALTRFMVQLIPYPYGGNGVNDDHFRQQSVQCLAPYVRATAGSIASQGVKVVAIDNDDGLDVLSASLGHNVSFSQVMLGAYRSKVPMADCYQVPGALLWRLYHTVLKMDYDVIARLLPVPLPVYARRQRSLENLDTLALYRVCVARKTIERSGARD